MSAQQVGPGDCFGELALLNAVGLPTVQAISEVDCQVLRRTALERPAAAAQPASVQTIPDVRGPAPRCHEWVAQQADNDCGVAALAMAARALGRQCSLETLRARLRVERQGANLQELQRAARELGFGAQAARIALHHLAAVRLPAIAHLTDGHFVVLFELADGRLVVGDPASGVGTWTLASLQRKWTGQLLLLMPM